MTTHESMWNQAWRKSHPEQWNKIFREYRYRIKHTAFLALGGKCVECGNTDMRVFQINHVNGGGSKEYRSRGVEPVYRDIILKNRRTDVNLMCANCNLIYEYKRNGRNTRKGFLNYVDNLKTNERERLAVDKLLKKSFLDRQSIS